MKLARIITIDDFVETYCKLKQRGFAFILSKFTFNDRLRTLSAFDTPRDKTSNWWTIPYIYKRWCFLVSGNTEINFQDYFFQKYFKDKKGLTILSLGTGSCKLELDLAKHSEFEKIVCVDIAKSLLNKAEEIANSKNLTNIEFLCTDLYKYDFQKESFDLVIFNSSLHHFKDIDKLLSEKVKYCLKKEGKLMINEYVGPDKLQFTADQIKVINQGIQLIDKKYRKRSGTTIYKNKFYGSGLLRMYVADPSECVESSQILPSIRKHFTILEEKPIGGNILMGVFKDIAYNFIEIDSEKEKIMQKLFDLEDEFIRGNPSDYLVGIYQKPN